MENGDIIKIDLIERTIEWEISDEELAKRREGWTEPEPKVKKAIWLVTQNLLLQLIQAAL